MSLKVNIDIARNNMQSRLKQTVVATLGVTFGIGMFIFVNSLISGTNDFQEKITLSSTPHVRIFSENREQKASLTQRIFGDDFQAIVHNEKTVPSDANLKDPYKIVDILRKDPQVIAVTPQVTSNVFYTSNAVQVNGTIMGVDIREENKMFDIAGTMKEGSIDNLMKNPDGLLIGIGVARKLNIQMNDNLTVTTANGVLRIMKVVGIFETTIASVDKSKAYSNISTVQKLQKQGPAYITDIKINLKDKEKAAAFARRYSYLSGYNAEDWKSANQQITVGFVIRNYIANSVVFTILLVAGFGIYNILNMTIYEKMKDIAILKATGFSGRDITQIFISQALFIGFFGGMIGLLLGFIISSLIGSVPLNMANVKTLPMNFKLTHYATGFMFGMIISFLSGWLPARKAAKIDPVQIIRG
ncbi:MAG TPA: FtsX-like permease family protein [Bacteroidales bacterium]|nr:FtsX-like permease family protein [Bacteroidales bacterium]